MNMPRFTAEASIYKIDKSYGGVKSFDNTNRNAEVLPQTLDYLCYRDCIIYFSRAECARACNRGYEL